MSRKNILLRFVGAATLAPLLSTAAFAQTSDASAGALGEVIVTAQRRGESMQDVPISVSAASAEMLTAMGVNATNEISTLAPSVRIATGLGGAMITVRGVGGTGAGVDESANSLYIDGVYLPSPSGALLSFNNIERIEVLKGPQGTLFGRNASGGLIQIITRAPQFTQQGKIQAGYANYNTTSGDAYFTAPLTDDIAFDISGTIQRQGEGWGKNVTTGADAHKGESTAARAKILWNISDATSLTGASTYAKTYAPSAQGSQMLQGERNTTTGVGGVPGFYDINESNTTILGTEEYNQAITLKHDLGFATFTSITAHDLVNWELQSDSDLSSLNVSTLNINHTIRTWTQELQLASNDAGPVTWVGGLYYFDLARTGFSRSTGSSQGANIFSRNAADATTKSKAAYGQATWEFIEGTRLTGGLRYTEDELFSVTTTTTGNPVTGATPVRGFQYSLETNKLTYRAALDHRLNEDMLVYTSYSRGFKSGLFNTNQPQFGGVKPQITDAFEVGLKSELLDNRLRLNIAAFHNDVQDLQVKGIPAGATAPIFYNAEGAIFKGVDIEAQAVVSEGFTISGNVSFLDGEYKNGTSALFFTVPPAPTRGLISSVGNASGLTPPLTSDVVASLTPQYRFAVGEGEIVLAGSYTYNSGYFFDPQDRLKQPAFSLLNASVAWKPTEALEFRVWGNNLTDKEWYANIEAYNAGDKYFVSAPRTFGISVGYSM